MSRRKINKIKEIIRKTEFNRNLFKYCINLLKRSLYLRNPSNKDMPWPSTIMLELTNRCNLHCRMCPREYNYGKSMKLGEMSSELAKEIIDSAYPYLHSIGLTGMGETLFAPNLLEVAKYIKSKKKSIVIFISTNANFTGFIEKITPVLPYLDTVQISMDGIGSIYEDIRIGGTFDRVDKNITELVALANQHRVDLMFNTVLNKRNYNSMSDLINYASEKGIKYVNFNYINLASITSVPVSYYEFFKSEEFIKEMEKAKLTAASHPEVEVTGIEFAGEKSFRKCPLVYNHFQINCVGELPPCCTKPFTKEYSFGNVKGKTIKQVLNSDSARAFRSHIAYGTMPKFCDKCHMIEI